MKIETKPSVVGNQKIEFTRYICEVCNRSYRTERFASTCEAACKERQLFLETNKPKYQSGSLVKSYYGDLYVVRSPFCHYCAANDYLGFTYRIDPFIEEINGNETFSEGNSIREELIDQLVLSPEEFQQRIDQYTDHRNVNNIVINNVRKTIGITLNINFSDVKI